MLKTCLGPLQQAMLSQTTNQDIAKILIDHGADLTIKDRFGRTPLHTADGSSIPSMKASLEAALVERDAKMIQNEKGS